MSELPLLYKGSVKDVYGTEGESPYVFAFSDRYSIFDWGAMPDELPLKGESLATMADFLFRYFGDVKAWQGWQLPEDLPDDLREELAFSRVIGRIRKAGMPHHSLGLVSANHEPVPAGKRSNRLAVEPVAVLRPAESSSEAELTYDYSAYANRPVNALVPLEIIFRFGAPAGSSFINRAAADPDYVRSLGLKAAPAAGDLFERPVVEFSTKLESTDRALSYQEAQTIADLSDDEFADLRVQTMLLALRLRDVFREMGLELWDGKFEFAFKEGVGRQREFQLVDSIGPDELRILWKDTQLSKEYLRQVYRGTDWYAAVEKAKEIAKEEAVSDWKKICVERLQAKPQPLPPPVKDAVSAMYPAFANEFARQFGFGEPFADVPPIREVAKNLARLLQAEEESS